MAKYNLVFFLAKDAIITYEIGTNGGLQIIKVKGFKKYDYEWADDFGTFFEALKSDIFNINSFSEGDFHATVLNKGVDGETVAEFKKYLDDCKEVCVMNVEASLALTEGLKDDSEIEELEKKVAEKESEINSLKEQFEIERREKAEKITQLESECKSLKDKVGQVSNVKETFMAALFPISDDGKSISSSITAKIVEKKVKDGDEVKKGDLIAVAEYKNMSFDIASPADGFVFFQCKDDTLALGQRVAIVHDRRYKVLKKVFADRNSTMPKELEEVSFGKLIPISNYFHHPNGFMTGIRIGELYQSIPFIFSDKNSKLDFLIPTDERNIPGYELHLCILKSIASIISEMERKTEDEIMIIPCVEPGTPVKRNDIIAEIVKEYEKGE